MNTILLALSLTLLTSCSTTHHHHHYNDTIMKDYRIVNHHFVDHGDYIEVVVKHKPHLTKHERQKLRKWANIHYKHHKKRIHCKFVVVG